MRVSFRGVAVEGHVADHVCALLGVWGVQRGVEIEERKLEVLLGLLPPWPSKVSSAFESTRKFLFPTLEGPVVISLLSLFTLDSSE